MKIKKSKLILVIIAIIGVALLILPLPKTVNVSSDQNEVSYYTEYLEKRLEKLISEMNGIERVSVFLTLENNGENVYAQNSNNSEYVIIGGKDEEEGLVLKEIKPSVRGVAVVCNGGDSVAVKEKITLLLSSSLGIPTNKISVTE